MICSRVRNFSRILPLLGLLFRADPILAAETWYYKSLLVGERASGMGGAYSAIADDPSGAWYNPAGLVMGRESYLSGSVNAYQTSSIEFENVLSGSSYVYRSQGLIPSFFGFTQELAPKTKFGFLLMVRDSLSQEQDDLLANLETEESNLTSITRQLLRNRTSYVVGPAISQQLSPRLMIGLSAFMLYQSERFLDQQRALYINDVDPLKRDYQLNMAYLTREAWGVMPKLGVLYIPHPRLSVGLTVGKSFHMAGTGSAKVMGTQVDGDSIVVPTGDFSTDFSAADYSSIKSRVLSPYEASLGLAWFPSEVWTLSAQLDGQTADPEFQYDVVPTWNAAVGAEWAGIPQMPMRLGFFTNNSNTRGLSSSGTDQREHVNQLGASGGLSWLSPGSSISVSTTYQWGLGSGQIISGITDIQDVSVSSLTFFLSGSYQL